jgi:hypothetical protein
MEAFVSVTDGDCFSIFEGRHEDDVAVIVIDDHDIVVAVAGRCNESTGLIRIDLASWFKD